MFLLRNAKVMSKPNVRASIAFIPPKKQARARMLLHLPDQSWLAAEARRLWVISESGTMMRQVKPALSNVR